MNAKVAGILTLLIGLFVFLGVTTPESFLKGINIENLLRRTSMYGILGIGVAFVIITAGIDLSIGSLVCLVSCLLAMFLNVEYQPFDVQPIISATQKDQSIQLDAKGPAIAPGDSIRYYGGRRAHSLIAKVTAVEHVDGQRKISLDRPVNRDDTNGYVTKLQSVVRFDATSDRPTVVLATANPGVEKRDRIWFLQPEGGIKQLGVLQTSIDGDTTIIQVDDTLGDFDQSWLAATLERQQTCSIPVAVTLVVAIALVLGMLHGLLVTKIGLQPFVVTLCGLLFYRGISRKLANDQTMGFGDEYASSLSLLGNGKLPIWQAADGSDSFGIPFPFFVLVVTAIMAAIFLNKTIWGRYMLALGRNEDAARYSGIPTHRMTLLAYVICSGMAALGGMLFALDSNSVAPSSFGNFFELYAIAAAVLGGCSLRGGEGGILGVVVGTALMQTLYNLIVLLGISDQLEFAIIGAVILLGVTADELVRRYSARRRAIIEARLATEHAPDSP